MSRRATFGLAAAWALAVVFAVHLLDFPGSVPRFASESGGGKLFDTAPAYSADAIYQRLESFGEAGRRSYEFRNVTVDVLLPLSMLPFLFLLMRRALARIQLHPWARVVLIASPFAYVLFDLVENALILVLLAYFPVRLNAVAELLPFVTLVKRGATVVAIFGPLIIFVGHLLRKKFLPSAGVVPGHR